MKGLRLSATAGVLLLIAGPVCATTVAGPDPNASLFTASSSTFGRTYSGVAELLIVRSDLGYGVYEGCSGALLADGISILTSAHCIADAKGLMQATGAYVTFTTADGTFTSQAVSFKIDPKYDGSATSPNDVAVLTLASVAPDTVTRYALYTGDASDQAFTLAGYGFGTLRVGESQYDSDAGTDDLMIDFTEGGGAYEAFVAPGDAGGPSFIDGEIAGVHSYAGLPGGGRPNALNLSLGEVAADASVVYNSDFIQSAMLVSPEPEVMILVGLALVAVALVGGKRKHP